MTELNKDPLSNLLIQFFTEDNEQALDLFFLIAKDLVFNFAYTITQSESAANKVVIHTFYQVFKKTKKCPAADSSDEKVKTWLLSIALIFTKQFSKNDNTNSSESNSYKTVSHKDNLKQILVLKILMQLQDMQKVSIILNHKENLSYSDIGDIYHLSQQAIKKNITNGIDQLKINLKNSGVSLTNDLIVREIEILKLPEASLELSNQIKTDYLMTLSLKELSAPTNNSSHLQWLIGLVLIIPVIFGIIYLVDEVYEMGKNQEGNHKPKIESKTEKLVATTPKTNKKLWDFTKENGEDITVIKGNWVHNPTLGFMKTDYNATTLIKTSFQFDKTSAPLVFKINSLIFNPFVDRPIASRLCGYLINNEKTVPYKFTNHITHIDKKEKAPLLHGNSVEYNVYLIIHQKGIFLVDRQNQFISSMLFTGNLSDNNIVALSFDNIYLKRMEVETLPILPLEWETHIQSSGSEQLPPTQVP